MVAIGGNSLIRSPEENSFADQLATVALTCRRVAELVKVGERVVLTHGNGPQVGFLLIRSHLARNRLPETPLDACNAQTQAEIGYMIQQVLDNELRALGLSNIAVTIVTQVLVDRSDPAFDNPTKPVGPFYTKAEAARLQKELGWRMMEDAGRGFRRIVPSPLPLAVIELDSIVTLLEKGAVVIACGGGGIAVTHENGRLQGVPAVIDKDLASALLANEIGADRLVITTAVEQVYLDYQQPSQRALREVCAAEMQGYLEQGQFPSGSMGPKVEAALGFLKRGGREVIITDPEHLTAALLGQAGTRVVACR